MVIAQFQNPWLVLGDKTRVSVGGEYEVKDGGKFRAVNLIDSVIRFAEELIKENRGKFIGYAEGWKPKVVLEGEQKLEFEIPSSLTFELGEGVIGRLLVNPIMGRVFGTVQVRDLVVEEEGSAEEVIGKLFELSIRHKLGVITKFLKVERVGDFLIFVDPFGEVALRLGVEKFEVNYVAVVGDVLEKELVFGWFTDVFEKRLDEGGWNKKVSANELVLERSDLEFCYDIEGKEIKEVFVSWGDFIAYKGIGESLVISDQRFKGETVVLRVAGLKKQWENLGKRLWDFLKFLVF